MPLDQGLHALASLGQPRDAVFSARPCPRQKHMANKKERDTHTADFLHPLDFLVVEHFDTLLPDCFQMGKSIG